MFPIFLHANLTSIHIQNHSEPLSSQICGQLYFKKHASYFRKLDITKVIRLASNGKLYVAGKMPHNLKSSVDENNYQNPIPVSTDNMFLEPVFFEERDEVASFLVDFLFRFSPFAFSLVKLGRSELELTLNVWLLLAMSRSLGELHLEI